jgi:hypothetical protein
MANAMIIDWQSIGGAPVSPGVYAWYYQPDVTDFDIKNIIDEIALLCIASKQIEAIEIIETFIIKRIYGYFRSDPYHVNLDGPLMPSFSGRADNDIRVSSSIVDRIIEDPKRLYKIRDQIRNAAPFFSSPLYIGKSDNLKERLITHKKLILKYREDQTDLSTIPESEATSFAIRVVQRRFPPEKLFVAVHCTPKDLDNIHVDVEHIFNRISYPILGRN